MVADLEDVSFDVCAGVEEVLFCRLLHISGEQERRVAVLNAQDDGVVVWVGVFLRRTEDSHRGAANIEGVAHIGHFKLCAALLKILYGVLEGFRRITGRRAVGGLCVSIIQRTGESSDMVCIPVRRYQNF